MWRSAIVAAVILTLGCGSALAESSLIVESKTVGIAASATVGVFMVNDEELRQVNIPLIVREVTPGVYPTALTASYNPAGRLREPGPYLDGTSFLIYYDNEDGNCKNGQPGGFGTISHSGNFEASYSVPSPSSPDGFVFARGIIIGGKLPVGTDGATPSMMFEFTAPMADGSFEIDSTCKDPGGHLLFVSAATSASVPLTFTKGVIDVLLCYCPHQCDYDADGFLTALDLSALIDVLFSGRPEDTDAGCPTSRGDFNNDGFPTAIDLGNMIDHLFASEPPPTDPCSTEL